ncbi:hypothetical protein PACTADRAFT_50892 [Pachysolen tannophilus NRRL Y-2460]|uniref:Uncharacterized protein n=1 Tax=Pachysolen tannophilus NRRL Y-2460 TaxID=669874 RepID=A0A1E4TTF7_PACTA|nr:hypothetical protein PACTADRAFT_50892 [Pachysolen tannophilus NRRL Y-2460]
MTKADTLSDSVKLCKSANVISNDKDNDNGDKALKVFNNFKDFELSLVETFELGDTFEFKFIHFKLIFNPIEIEHHKEFFKNTTTSSEIERNEKKKRMQIRHHYLQKLTHYISRDLLPHLNNILKTNFQFEEKYQDSQKNGQLVTYHFVDKNLLGYVEDEEEGREWMLELDIAYDLDELEVIVELMSFPL